MLAIDDSRGYRGTDMFVLCLKGGGRLISGSGSSTFLKNRVELVWVESDNVNKILLSFLILNAGIFNADNPAHKR